MPRSSASCFTSTTVTGMPALAKHMAMPPPMVPAPMIAALATGAPFNPAGMPGTFCASRSAKKAWRWARLSSLPTSSVNSLRSSARPSSIGMVTAARTASMQAAGARWPRARLSRGSAASSSKAGFARASASLSSRSRTLASGLPMTERAKATASSRVEHTASARPGNVSTAMWVPPTIAFIAATGPITRGRRWVPPAPGRMPSLTSGSPTLAPGEATR